MSKAGSEQGPDKGWSWVVAFAACFSSLVLAGIFRTGGVLFVAFIDSFGVTREEASWPMVICISVLNLTGPFSGILGQKYGARPIVMIGALIGGIGVSSCFLTTSLDVVTIMFGGVFGIGYGLVNTLMPVIVNAYFLELRGTANGIANSGSCIGSVILPVLFEYLIDHFGLSGCFLLTGGIVLNVAIAGALLRPPPWLKKSYKNEVNYTSCSGVPTKCYPDTRSNVKYSADTSVSKPVIDVEYQSPVKQQSPHDSLHAELVEKLKNLTKVGDTVTNALTVYKEPSFDSFTTSSSLCVKQKEESDFQTELFRAQQEFQESLSDFQSTVMSILETSQSEEILNKFDDTDGVKASELTDSCPARHSFSISSSGRRPIRKFNKTAILSSRPLKKSSLKFEHSSADLLPVPENFNQTTSPAKDESEDTIPSETAVQLEEKQTDRDTFPIRMNESIGIFRSFHTVLTSPMFYVTALTNVSFYFLFHMYVVIIVDYSLDCGVPSLSTKYVIFAFSAADLFGRLCLGWITDRKYITRSHFVMICMAAIGVVFFIFPFATDYWTLIVTSAAYGLLLGCTMVVFPILLVDYLGREVHAVAYGCLCFMNGFVSLTRPIIIGYFRDNMKSYSNMFYILGLISLIASSAWLLENCFIRKKRASMTIDNNVKHEMTGYAEQKNDTESP